MSVIEKHLRSTPTHLCYVSSDLTEAQTILRGLFGVPQFSEIRGGETSHQQYRGVPAAIRIDVALVWTGSIFLEIIQPLTPDSPYSSYIKPSGFSLAFHHFGLDVDDWDQFLREFKEDGQELIYSAEAEGYNRYGYWDVTDTLGHMIEFTATRQQGTHSLKHLRLDSSKGADPRLRQTRL